MPAQMLSDYIVLAGCASPKYSVRLSSLLILTSYGEYLYLYS